MGDEAMKKSLFYRAKKMPPSAQIMLLFAVEGVFLQYITSINGFGLNLYATNMGATDSQIGIIQMVPNIVACAALLPLGILADHLKSTKTIPLLTLLMMCAGYAFLGSVPVLGERRMDLFFVSLAFTAGALAIYNAQWQAMFGAAVSLRQRNDVYAFRNQFMFVIGIFAPVMQDIQQRDDNLYRVVLQADPVSDAVRKAGYGGTNRYEQLRDMANADLVINTTQKLDMLNRQLYIQSKSFDEVVDLCKSHDEMLKCIPAIQPVSNKDLKKTASGYGVRIDPIYKTTKFHAGMDFSASPGTPVYATGDGVVVKAGWETGYGNTIEVNHGFGYLTRYAHLSAYKVRPGQKVVRIEVIGAVGSTGKSTGPHLHYEVHVKGKVQNPVNYYFMDLSAEDYDKMIQIAANHGKVFD